MKKLFCLSLLQNYTRILLYTHNQKAIGAMLTLLWRTIDNPPRDTKLTVSAMSLIWLMVLSISWKGKTLVQSTLETEEFLKNKLNTEADFWSCKCQDLSVMCISRDLTFTNTQIFSNLETHYFEASCNEV
ncbi:uncharacterized protein LOC129320224 isoform X1 [Prosopis cineraria]|uniref:uncharacterized protein LOC129320224 isoform X1 n=1 Tax=Prosopis cineraria TaxID=364024 RepID=UPI00241057EB|nr:uncharacterized protein LOC129320224 isoform X1 [Prosopis cineraria]